MPIRQRNPVGKFALAETVVQALVIGEHGDAVGRCRIGGIHTMRCAAGKVCIRPKTVSVLRYVACNITGLDAHDPVGMRQRPVQRVRHGYAVNLRFGDEFIAALTQ